MSTYKPVYIYDMPYSKKRKLANMLDIDGQWRSLAGSIGLSAQKVDLLALNLNRPGGSPTEMLLTDWGHRNPTVDMLVFHLRRVGLIRAAELFRELVPSSAFTNDIAVEPSTVLLPTNGGSSDGLPLPDISAMPSPQFMQVHKSASANQLNKPLACNYCDNHINIPANAIHCNCSTPPSHYMDYTQSTNYSKMAVQCEQYRPKEKAMASVAPTKIAPELMPSNICSKCSEVNEPQQRRQAVESVEPHTQAFPFATSVHQDKSNGAMLPSPLTTVRYTYEDIKAATSNFSEHNIIGRGGFGTVYLGKLKHTKFAIKRLNTPTEKSQKCLPEIFALQKYRHANIITLCGCSFDGPQVCLVYEHMSNGSLRDRLECKNSKCLSLTCWQRQTILRDAAAGLQYLHGIDPSPVIHGNIKSANILLGSHFEAKISDFGLAKEATGGSSKMGPNTHVTRKDMEGVCGLNAYLPADFLSNGCQFHLKTDVYSFGVVIFETCTALNVYDDRRHCKRLVDHVSERFATGDRRKVLELKDSEASYWPDNTWLELLTIGQRCTSKLKKDRPAMAEVHMSLEQLISTSQINEHYVGEREPVTSGKQRMPFSTPDVYPYPSYDTHKVKRVVDHNNDLRPFGVSPMPVIDSSQQSSSSEHPQLDRSLNQFATDSSSSDLLSPSSSSVSTDDLQRLLINDKENRPPRVRRQPDEIEYENDEERAATHWSVRHEPTENECQDGGVPSVDRFDGSFLDDDESLGLRQKKDKLFPAFLQGALNDLCNEDETCPLPPTTKLSSVTPAAPPSVVYKFSGGLVQSNGRTLPPPLDGFPSPSGERRPIVGPPSLEPDDLERVARLEMMKASVNYSPLSR